jgi:[acyl-carrier-protein] S-malonyltransferase
VALGYLVGISGFPLQPTGAEFYERYGVMRTWCDQVESWTGIEILPLLSENYTGELIAGSLDAQLKPPDLSARPEFFGHAQIRQAVHIIGVFDILAEQGIYPDVVAGTSLGGLIAACLAGSVEREDVFRLIVRRGQAPLAPEGEPACGIAFAVLPPTADVDWYCGESRPNVYMIADYEFTGTKRVLMLSGHLKDLGELAAEAPPGHVPVVSGAMGAIHCPLQQFMCDLLGPDISDMNVRDPEITLLSGNGSGAQLEAGVPLKTAEDVRRSILDSYVTPVGSFKKIMGAFDEHGAQMVLGIGGPMPAGLPATPFPVLPATVPDDIGQIMTMIYDLGLEVGR